MANTYSSSLRLIIQQDGTNQGIWGGYTNTNIASLIEQAITGVGAITVSGSSDYTLTVTNGASDEARNAILNITGTLTAAINVICPTAAKTYIIKNGTTGGFAITLKTSAGSGISVPNGSTALLYCNGTSVVEGVNYSSGFTAANLTYTGALTGGTGVVNIGSGQIYKDSSGNLGLGVTPKTSTGSYVAFEFGQSGYLAAVTSGAGIQLASNTYVAAGSVNRYSTTGAATYYGQSGGIHSWHNAPSGTAGDAISFTQAMTLDASGNLLVGTTSYTGAGVSISSPTANGSYSVIASAGTGYHWRFGNVSNGIVGSISSSTTATSFNTSSDQRLKTDSGIATSTDVIDNTRIHDFEWKADGSKSRGVFAQEAYKVKPEAVSVGKDELNKDGLPVHPWGVDYSKYVPDLIVYCQQLRKELDELKSQLGK